MPHQRKRYLSENIKKALKYSQVVGVFGQRQTGKTTLTQNLSTNYITLDQRTNLDAALTQPEFFVKSKTSPMVIDECQLAPPLFSAIKEELRLRPGKGRFILTGSTRFLGKKDVRESLTGRITNFELLPLSISEILELPLNDPLRAIKSGATNKKRGVTLKQCQSFLNTGGLPGICFYREEHIRTRLFESHLDTLFERDLKIIYDTNLSYAVLRNLLSILAAQQGDPFDLGETASKARVARDTLKKLLQAFETLFLIRRLETRGGTKRPIYFLEDQGLASHLLSRTAPSFDKLRILYSNIRHQFVYRHDLVPIFFQYRTRGGAMVPLCIETKKGIFGYIPLIGDSPSQTEMASASSFLKQFKNSHIFFANWFGHSQIIFDRCINRPIEELI